MDPIYFKNPQEFRDWLDKNHDKVEEQWIGYFKKATGKPSMTWSESVDQAICYGWIDGIRRKLDENRTMQLIAPRKAVHWTKTYKDRAARLIEEGRMEEAGFQSIEVSKKSGLWNFMDDVDKLIIPKDLESELRTREGAFDFFVNINDSSKRFVLRWIKLAKTEKTRASRILKIADLSARREKLKGS